MPDLKQLFKPNHLNIWVATIFQNTILDQQDLKVVLLVTQEDNLDSAINIIKAQSLKETQIFNSIPAMPTV